MQITLLEAFKPRKERAVITIGNFDGLHLGHRAIFERVQQPGLERIAITFTNHPREILRGSKPALLQSFSERLRGLSSYFDSLILLEFSKELSRLPAEEFLLLLMDKIPLAKLVLGENAHLGHEREGTPAKLSMLAQALSFEIQFVPPVKIHDTTVSSSHIRKLIALGALDEASLFLGRPYSIKGKAERGHQLGRTLKIATLNLALDDLIHPPTGVWVVEATLRGIGYEGVANLGTAPTLKQLPTPLLEVHLFDFDEEIYDEEVEIRFLHFLRNEKKFDSPVELGMQIRSDIAQAKSFFTSTDEKLSLYRFHH